MRLVPGCALPPITTDRRYGPGAADSQDAVSPENAVRVQHRRGDAFIIVASYLASAGGSVLSSSTEKVADAAKKVTGAVEGLLTSRRPMARWRWNAGGAFS